MGLIVFAISFMYLFAHVSNFGFNAGDMTDAQLFSHGFHALIVSLGFVTLAIEGKSDAD